MRLDMLALPCITIGAILFAGCEPTTLNTVRYDATVGAFRAQLNTGTNWITLRDGNGAKLTNESAVKAKLAGLDYVEQAKIALADAAMSWGAWGYVRQSDMLKTYLAGIRALGAGKYRDARDLFDQCLACHPRLKYYSDTEYRVALCHLALNDPAAARTRLVSFRAHADSVVPVFWGGQAGKNAHLAKLLARAGALIQAIDNGETPNPRERIAPFTGDEAVPLLVNPGNPGFTAGVAESGRRTFFLLGFGYGTFTGFSFYSFLGGPLGPRADLTGFFSYNERQTFAETTVPWQILRSPDNRVAVKITPGIGVAFLNHESGSRATRPLANLRASATAYPVEWAFVYGGIHTALDSYAPVPKIADFFQAPVAYAGLGITLFDPIFSVQLLYEQDTLFASLQYGVFHCGYSPAKRAFRVRFCDYSF